MTGRIRVRAEKRLPRKGGGLPQDEPIRGGEALGPLKSADPSRTADEVRARTRLLEHVGELAVRVQASSLEEIFKEVAKLIAREAGHSRRSYGPWERVSVEARDCAGLLVDWANELVGRSEAGQRAFDRLRSVKISGCDRMESPRPPVPPSTASELDVVPACRVEAELSGRAVPLWRSRIKAATYHAVAIRRRASGWEATLLFDI